MIIIINFIGQQNDIQITKQRQRTNGVCNTFTNNLKI